MSIIQRFGSRCVDSCHYPRSRFRFLSRSLGLRLGLRLTNAAAVSILITFSIESAKEGVKVVCHGERKRFSVKKDEWFQEMRGGDERKIGYRSVTLTVKSSLPSYT
jgi:hypothetical protein